MDEDRAAQDERAGAGASTSEQRRQGGPNTAQSRDERLKDLQGNATGVVLNDEQRTRVRDTIINARGAPRVGSVDFDVPSERQFRAVASRSFRCRRRWCRSSRSGAAFSILSFVTSSSSSIRRTWKPSPLFRCNR